MAGARERLGLHGGDRGVLLRGLVLLDHDRNIGISLVFCRIHRHKIILQSSTYALSRGLLETQCVIGMEPWSLGGMEPCSSLEHGL